MVNKWFLSVTVIFIGAFANAQEVKVSSGAVTRYEIFSNALAQKRTVDVWLPHNYSAKKKYAVLYMQDGQMLFDSTTTWNHQEWKVDETIAALLEKNSIKNCIVVGIWNSGKMRHADYFPQKPFENYLTTAQKDSIYNANRQNGVSVFNDYKIQSDNYLKFLVSELKPFIDSTYSTLKNKINTFIAGSSMGGLISLYAICEYPNVFGGAACLSTHWPGIFQMENNPVPEAIFSYLKNNLPKPKTHKIYFDHGTETLDALYPKLQQKADSIMIKGKFDENHWKTIVYTGHDHSEKSWAARFSQPILFFIGKK